jgi:hypothetical protein
MKYFSIVLVLAVSSISMSFPGNAEVSFAQKQFNSSVHPYLSDRFSVFYIGSEFNLSGSFNCLARIGYGSTVVSSRNTWTDDTGRIWTFEAGADYCMPSLGFFFLRATAGSAYILRSYEYSSNIRFTYSQWQTLLSMGIGSRFPLSSVPLLSNVEIVLSYEILGSDRNLICGGIGIGI